MEKLRELTAWLKEQNTAGLATGEPASAADISGLSKDSENGDDR